MFEPGEKVICRDAENSPFLGVKLSLGKVYTVKDRELRSTATGKNMFCANVILEESPFRWNPNRFVSTKKTRIES